MVKGMLKFRQKMGERSGEKKRYGLFLSGEKKRYGLFLSGAKKRKAVQV
jgi:hypothetical protein